eukprot:6862319-Pyramimonas_sp.AAC.1
MREWARIQGLAPIDGDEVRSAAARMKARTGLGVDQLTLLDIQRLPSEGHEALAGILNLVDDTGTWPTQLLCALGRLLPKKADGDRIM